MGPTCAPRKRRAMRSRIKARKGATPVPGPTMMTGHNGSAGSLKLDVRMWTGTLPWREFLGHSGGVVARVVGEVAAGEVDV
ncbi:hypothetical protein VCV18_009633 [Metarhizium anisopliae]